MLAMAAGVAACSSSGDGGSGTGTLNVQVTDAPVDGVSEIMVKVDGTTLKPKQGAQTYHEAYEKQPIDLLTLYDGESATLLNKEVEAGEYNWMKLEVSAECDGIMDSYVVDDTGAMVELRVPSGDTSGLKMGNHFTVVQGSSTTLMIDWNTRLGLNAPGETDPGEINCYKLKPSLRVVDMTLHGSISGTVDTALITDGSCTSDPNTGAGNVVYVYEGDLEESMMSPDDIDGVEPDPIATADVRLNDATGNQEYLVPFLSPGDYSVAFTCQAGDDTVPDPDMLGLMVDEEISFTDGGSVMVMDGETTVVDFTAM
jgi:hypothetical protein